MEYRVYDSEKECWVKDNIYLNPDGELFLIKQSLFGMVKVPLVLDSERYVYHRAIDLWDKDKNLVYEGDYILAKIDENKSVIGMVAYAQDLSAYVILVESTQEFFTLGSEVTEFIQVIGNVFDGYEEVVQNGEQALQSSEE